MDSSFNNRWGISCFWEFNEWNQTALCNCRPGVTDRFMGSLGLGRSGKGHFLLEKALYCNRHGMHKESPFTRKDHWIHLVSNRIFFSLKESCDSVKFIKKDQWSDITSMKFTENVWHIYDVRHPMYNKKKGLYCNSFVRPLPFKMNIVACLSF